MIPSDPLFHKPKSIIAAKNILFATIFLDIIILAINKFTNGSNMYSNPQGLGIPVLVLVVIFVLIRQVGLGKAWARSMLLIFLILLIAGAILFPFLAFMQFRANLLEGVLILAQAVLEVLALRFLFSKESNEWFIRVRPVD